MGRREFQFVEGSSQKFWAIELAGSSFTVNWGRIGTSGQTQTKDFSSDAEAKKQHDKLVAEKLHKGYSEAGGSNVAAATAGAPSPAPTLTPTTKKSSRKVATEAKEIPDTSAEEVSPPKPAVPSAIGLDLERSIDLDPKDWSVATWRPRLVKPRPAPRPFDLAQRQADVARVPQGMYGWKWDWTAANIPVAMSPEEAHFWLTAMCLADQKIKPTELAEQLGQKSFEKIDASEIQKLFKTKKTGFRPEVLLPLLNLVSLEEFVEMIDEKSVGRGAHYMSEMRLGDDPEVTVAIRDYIIPYLTDAEWARLRAIVAPRIDASQWPTDHYKRPAASFFIAAMIGLSKELLLVVQQWKEGFYTESGWDHTHYHQPQIIALGLGEPTVIESVMRRHKLPLIKPDFIRGWLATTEFAALDYVRDCILAIGNKEEAESLLKAFALVHAPEAAPHMLELKISSKAPKLAREWLDANVGFAIAGLIPAAAGRGKLADAAIEHLRDLRRGGHGGAIAKAAGEPPPERIKKEVIDHVEKTYTPFDQTTTPQWLADALKESPKAAKLPGWLPAHVIPLLTVGEFRLNNDQLQSLISALQKSPLSESSPLIKAIREHSGRESRDAFAWRLFEMWQAEGAPSKDKWAMGAIGHLGGDGCVLKLTPLIRAWPGESQHQRAVFGLDCLRAVGSDTALMSLNGIAQKLKFKGLKTKAMEFMDAIANTRGMTRAQLEDRIVPDCDLDARGTRVFDFGPRQFRLVLGAEMKPMIKDADGKVKSDLPAPNAKDNAALANEAVATWKLLKKQVKEVAKIQAERLEQAMVTGRRWTPEEFETLLVKHPLMINLVRLAVWAAYDEAGKPLSTFRVTEDQTLADANDDETELPKGVVSVGIVHPAHLSKDALGAWGQIFSDYELIPPFEQLGRHVYALEGEEAKQTEFKRFADKEVPPLVLVGILDRLAWVRGIPQDGGVFYEHTKPFYGAGVTCVVQYEPGVPVGYMEGWEDQKNMNAFFIPGIYKPQDYPDHKQRLKLGEVDPVVMSEVIRDLNVIASKAKE